MGETLRSHGYRGSYPDKSCGLGHLSVPPLRISQGFQWCVTSCGPSRGAWVGVNFVLPSAWWPCPRARSGMRVSKLKAWCLEGEEGKAALGEGRKALFEVSKADVFSNCCLAGTCCSRDSPCSSAPGRAGGASLCPLRSKGSPGGDTLSPSAPCGVCPPACMLPGEAAGPLPNAPTWAASARPSSKD